MQTDIKISPENILPWGCMEDWVNGASSAPSGWTLSGTGAACARESSIVKKGIYSAKLTYGSADLNLYFDLSNYTDYAGRLVTFGAWVYCSTASIARLQINDGSTTTSSSYHTGDGTWQYLTVSANLSSSNIKLRVICDVSGSGLAYFDGAILCEGDLTFTDLSTYVEKWVPSGKYVLGSFQASRRHGAIIPALVFDQKSIDVDFSIIGSTVAAARSTHDILMKALTPQRTRADGKTLRHDLYLYDDRLLKVLITSLDPDNKAALKVLLFKAKFLATDPFYQAQQKTRNSIALSSSPITFTVTTVGSIHTLPLFQFTPAGSNMTTCTLENLTSGETFSFVATVNTGQVLSIDSDLVAVTNNGVDSIASFTGDFMSLVPGVNTLRFTGTTGGNLLIDWYEHYV